MPLPLKQRRELPTTEQLADPLELVFGQSFGQNISLLMTRSNLANFDMVRLEMGAEPMVLDCIVLGPRSNASWFQICKLKSACIVFPNSHPKRSIVIAIKSNAMIHRMNECLERKDTSHGDG